MAARNGEGMVHPGVHGVPRRLTRNLDLLTGGPGLLLHSIHALEELANELTRCSGGLYAEVVQHEPHREAKVVGTHHLELERFF